MYLLVVWILFSSSIQGQTWDKQYDKIAESGYSVYKICEVDNGYIYGNLGIGGKMNLFKVEKETGEIIWHKEHRITNYTWPAKILPMTEKRLLIIGCTTYEQFLLITDSLGNELKKKVWQTGGYYLSGLTKIVQNNDSTYTALGFLANESSSSYFSLVKFDKNLEIIWEKSYFVGEGNICAQSIIKDGENYIALGILRGSVNALKPGLIKFDKNGNILWQKKYPEYSFAAGLSNLINLSNGYLASSLSRHNGNAGPDYAALMKIDKNGNIVLFKDSILDFLDFGLMIKVWEINNEYVGVVRAQPAPYPETYTVKTDTFGNVIAYKKWNRIGVLDAILTQDQHLLVGGGNSYSEKPWAFKTSIPGPINIELTSFTARQKKSIVIFVWQTGSETDNFGFIIERRNNENKWIDIASYTYNEELEGAENSSSYINYQFKDENIVSGMTYDYRLSNVDYLGTIRILKTITINIADNSTDIPENYALEPAYPNPFNSATTISYDLPNSSFVTISIYDINGRFVEKLVNENKEASSYFVKWNTSQFSSGIYLYKIQVNDFTDVNKCILLK